MSHSPDVIERLYNATKDRLTAREQKVIFLSYGIEGERPYSLEEIGALLGENAQIISEIRNEALTKIRGVPEVEATLVFMPFESVQDREPVPIGLVIELGDSSASDLANLYLALSDLYRAYGGTGLTFRSTTDVQFRMGAT